MSVIVVYICWVLFVPSKTSAVVVNNDKDSNGDYGLVKELAQMKDPADFRFTKFLDVRIDVDDNKRFDKKGIDWNRLKKLDALTYQIENVSKILIEINGEMAAVRKNMSNLSKNQMRIHKDIQNSRFSISKSSNGVTYNGLYPRTEPGGTKGNQTINIPRDCYEVKMRGNNVSGVYEIHPKLSPKPFLVLCDMETVGGGWTHIQKRFDGSQEFFLGWREYKFGFGDLDGEFWLGLQNIHYLTSAGSALLIEVVNLDQKTSYAHYGQFKIGPEPDGYPLSDLNSFSGDAGDSLKYHIGMRFSTKDYDQDEMPKVNCAETYKGAWWFKACMVSDLNAKFINSKTTGPNSSRGAQWGTINVGYTLAKTRMLVRPASV